MALCGDNGFIGEFDLETGKQIKVLPKMFKGDNAQDILNIGNNDFAVATRNGLFFVNMKTG